MKCTIALVAGLVIASASSAAFAKDVLPECVKFADGWKAAYNNRNADALAAMYDPKKGAYSNVFWTGMGHNVLVQAFKQELSIGNTMTSIRCDTSTSSGDVAVSAGTWSAMTKGPDGKGIAIGGHWQSSAAGRNGKYLLLNHTSNMQLPPPQ